MHFDCVRLNGNISRFPVTLNLPGRHNVLNALAAIAVAIEVGVPDAAIAKALTEFKGVGRRFQSYGEISLKNGGSFTLIDDYGHHPVEMAATLGRGAPAPFPGRRLVLAFQLHRYTRTRDCFEDFVKVLAGFRRPVLAEVCAAGEPPLCRGRQPHAVTRLTRCRPRRNRYSSTTSAAMPQAILDFARAEDMVIAMGAGSIGGVPRAIGEKYQGCGGLAKSAANCGKTSRWPGMFHGVPATGRSARLLPGRSG